MNRRDVLRGMAAVGVVAWGGPASGTADVQCRGEQVALGVHLNQVGFLPGRVKRAAVVLTQVNSEPVGFRVVDAASGAVRFQGKLGPARMDAASGDVVAWADFSALKQSGTYRLEVCGVRSDAFVVADDVYRHALWLTTRAYYGQRCGCAVDLGGGYKHPPCHLKGAYHATSGRAGAMRNTGGWHDAGDYGRYVVNSGITCGTLLWAWEMYPQALRGMTLGIPESGNSVRGVPDFLAEVRWNLEWMLSLQDADGGVWHKQTSEVFAAFVMPQDDASVSYVIGTGSVPYKSTAATADLASVAAIGARCYREFDGAFADGCLAAAKKAWTWAIANPDVEFRNPPGIKTGEYGDRTLTDELLWASAELFRTTGEREYEKAFVEGVGTGDLKIGAPSWNSVAPMAYWTYVMADRGDSALVERIKLATVDAARVRIARAQANGYGNTLDMRQYHWGSNSDVGNDALLLLISHRFAPGREPVEVALSNLHYLLGCNCHGVSWVTQLGTRPFMHPHHRPSAADGIEAPWPGMLSGGPNQYGGDVVANAVPKQPPMKMWVDDQRAYSMNEIAINWNAPLVFLLAAANA